MNGTKLSELLIAEQTRRGWTDRECAAEIGTMQQTYNSWKNGRKPRAETHQSIARFLRMKVNKLRTEIADAPPMPVMREIKLEAVGDRILITRRGGGAIVVESGRGGFIIETAPKQA